MYWFRLIMCFGVACLAGCPASGEDVRPPRDQIFFPTGLATGPDEEVLFVANANSDLRFDSGSLALADLDRIDSLIETWLTDGAAPAGCTADPELAHVVQCDESEVLVPDATVRIGNFATAVGVQQLASNDLRLFLPVRGDPSVTWIDYSVADRTLDCGGTGTLPLCDDAHRLTQYRSDLELPSLVEEPFGIHVDGGNGYGLVAHLDQAAVSLIEAPPDGGEPQLVDVVAGLFATDPGTGARSAVGVAGRMPGMPEDLKYVTSRSENRVQMLYVHRPAGVPPTLVPSEYFFLEQVLPSDDGRGITFSGDGERAYIINRDPPMLQIIDTTLDDEGFPRNRLEAAVEICRGGSLVEVADVGRGERAYVSCFPAGQVWVVDPGRAVVEAVIDVGRGPNATIVSERRNKLYTANFLEDTIAVVDIEPDSPTENLMVLRLGTPRQQEEQ